MGTNENTPALSKIALGRLLMNIRERSNLGRPEVAEALGVDTETIRRWELGKIAPKRHALESLCGIISATTEELSRLTSLSLSSKGRGMFEGNSVAPNLRVFYESEATAIRIQSIGLESLPGLLQTRAYQRANQAAQLPIDDERAAGLRELRTRRQEINFGRHPLPRMEFLIGRAALSYLDDYPDLRDEQIARIREVAAMPRADVRVVKGFHAAMPGSFTILTPPPGNGARPFVYVEAIDGGRYIEGNVVSEFGTAFDMVSATQSVAIEEVLG
jgi:transcriptional regulator with XRE-family HTH domain